MKLSCLIFEDLYILEGNLIFRRKIMGFKSYSHINGGIHQSFDNYNLFWLLHQTCSWCLFILFFLLPSSNAKLIKSLYPLSSWSASIPHKNLHADTSFISYIFYIRLQNPKLTAFKARNENSSNINFTSLQWLS